MSWWDRKVLRIRLARKYGRINWRYYDRLYRSLPAKTELGDGQ